MECKHKWWFLGAPPNWQITETKLQKLEERIRSVLIIFKNWERYKYWRGKRNGRKYIDAERGSDFNPPLGIVEEHQKIWEGKLKSGRVGVYRLISYFPIDDGEDLFIYARSEWDLIGHKGFKAIRECSFEEYLLWYVWTIGAQN